MSVFGISRAYHVGEWEAARHCSIKEIFLWNGENDGRTSRISYSRFKIGHRKTDENRMGSRDEAEKSKPRQNAYKEKKVVFKCQRRNLMT
jgi:hypothetical protein